MNLTHARLQGAATWRIRRHHISTVGCVLWKFCSNSCNRYSV